MLLQEGSVLLSKTLVMHTALIILYLFFVFVFCFVLFFVLFVCFVGFFKCYCIILLFLSICSSLWPNCNAEHHQALQLLHKKANTYTYFITTFCTLLLSCFQCAHFSACITTTPLSSGNNESMKPWNHESTKGWWQFFHQIFLRMSFWSQ